MLELGFTVWVEGLVGFLCCAPVYLYVTSLCCELLLCYVSYGMYWLLLCIGFACLLVLNWFEPCDWVSVICNSLSSLF